MDRPSSSPSPIDRWLLQALIAGASASLLLPFAQAKTATFGWLPLWLVGLPLAAWLGWRGLSRVGTMPASVAAARGRRRIDIGPARGRRSAGRAPMAARRTPARA